LFEVNLSVGYTLQGQSVILLPIQLHAPFPQHWQTPCHVVNQIKEQIQLVIKQEKAKE